MREKQKQRKRLTTANNTNDNEMMMKIFDNVQEKVRLSKDLCCFNLFFDPFVVFY